MAKHRIEDKFDEKEFVLYSDYKGEFVRVVNVPGFKCSIDKDLFVRAGGKISNE